jgi:UDPglucose 6-dehydrogenase
MSTVGWIGLGRLGLTCALALAEHGKHQVEGFDVSERPYRILGQVEPAHEEAGLADLVAANDPATRGHGLRVRQGLTDVIDKLEDGSCVFVAVQTPHDPRYGGETPTVEAPVDFEYGYLIQAVRDINTAAEDQGKRLTIVVVSTVLPGTVRAHLAPLCGPRVKLAYNPFFIALTTTLSDYLYPEFVLLGTDDDTARQQVEDLYATIHNRPVHAVSIESAELLKVAYNCFISMKIVFANMVMEICQKTGADCDQIADGLALATDRIASPAYMRGGMGDSGACHPRDNQAMSWLAQRLDLSVDLMGYVSQAREQQSGYLAGLVEHWHRMSGLPIVLLGKAYKPNVSLVNGSAGLLLAHQLRDRGLELDHWDPHVDGSAQIGSDPSVFVITTRHDLFLKAQMPPGSVVIDPHGYMPDQPGVTTIRVGRKT